MIRQLRACEDQYLVEEECNVRVKYCLCGRLLEQNENVTLDLIILYVVTHNPDSKQYI
jgi:hypothetical protein